MNDADLTAEAERLADVLLSIRSGYTDRVAASAILTALAARLAAETARADKAEAEVEQFREERSFVIGWNDGFEEGKAQFTLGFGKAMQIAQQGFETWAAKPHNRRWFRRIDGTPIPNDLTVTIAEAFTRSPSPTP